jgi:ATP-dependent DNA ligase
MSGQAIYVRDYRTEIPGGLNDDRTEWQFPVIKSTNAHGRETFWKIYVRLARVDAGGTVAVFIEVEDKYFDNAPLDADIAGWINVDSGVLGGKTKKSSPTVVKVGKNLGRAGATNVWTQALRDAYGIYNRQLKKSAHGAAGVAAATGVEMFPPMLAQTLASQKTPLIVSESSSVFVQRKYNGVRAVATLKCNGDPADAAVHCEVVMYSRRKNIYPGLPRIRAELLPVLRYYWEEGRRLYLDGELYKHGVALQDISGHARREGADDAAYEYMIYDCFVADEPTLKYQERKAILDFIFEEFALNHARAVETFIATSHDEIKRYYEQFLSEGFEGAMIRTNSTYQYSYNERHSKVLLKMKPTEDAEMVVVGYTTGGKGKAAAALMIICETPGGKVFPVTPAMEIDDRIALAKKMGEVELNGKTHFENHWKGQKIIIYFDEYSKDGVPQRARTKLEKRTWD